MSEIRRLPFQIKAPATLEAAISFTRGGYGKWMAIAYDEIIEALNDLGDSNQAPAMPITLGDALSTAEKNATNDIERARARKHRKSMEQVSRTLLAGPRNQSSDDETGFLDEKNPFRGINQHINMGLDGDGVIAFLRHPHVRTAIESLHLSSHDCIESFKSGQFALLVDRETREVFVGPYEDVCKFAEDSEANSKGQSRTRAIAYMRMESSGGTSLGGFSSIIDQMDGDLTEQQAEYERNPNANVVQLNDWNSVI